MRQIAPRGVLYRCDRKPLAKTIVHSNGNEAVYYTSLIDLRLYLFNEMGADGGCITRPPRENTAKTCTSLSLN